MDLRANLSYFILTHNEKEFEGNHSNWSNDDNGIVR